MKSSLAAAVATVVFTGASLLGMSSAFADPGMSITAGGAPVVDGSAPDPTQSVLFNGTGCQDTDHTPGYFGLFTSGVGDPMTNPESAGHGEGPADADGNFSTVGAPIQGEGDVTTGYLRWYCSRVPVNSLASADVLYASPLMTITLSHADGAKVALSKKGLTVKATKAGPGSSMTVSVDPDALPLVDKVNIPGDQAATLKSKTDTAFDGASVVSRIYTNLIRGNAADKAPFDAMVTANRPATDIAAALYANPVAQTKLASLTDTAFVNAAFKGVLLRAATPDELTTFTAKLTAGDTRSNVLWKVGAYNDRTRATSSYVAAAFAVAGRTKNVPGTLINSYAAQIDTGATTKVKVVEDIVLASR